MESLGQRLAALERSILPTWVYDHEHLRFPWANEKALAFWRAASRDELLARDLSDLSAATRARLEGYLRVLAKGGTVEEDWTLYPRGVSATVTLHGQGVHLDDGRLAILFQALEQAPGVDASMVRGVEAVRHSSVLVSLLDAEGRVLFHNPAALRALGEAPRLDGAFADPEVAAAIQGVIETGEPWEAEVLVRTAGGERWHLVEVRRTTDPVTGARAALVQQLDRTAQRRAEGLLEEQLLLIEELNRTLLLVEEQRREILTLSAPILDVGRGTLAVPLIGRLDAERGAELSERLLPVVARGASSVILDLTGANALDPDGAAALTKLAQALTLLGARPLVTGVRGEVARALVESGILAEGLTVLRSLGQGLEACRRRAAV